jgi:hypothetical protein
MHEHDINDNAGVTEASTSHASELVVHALRSFGLPRPSAALILCTKGVCQGWAVHKKPNLTVPPGVR